MLTRIQSDKLIESDIKFGSGLNVVVGDATGANSLGKSTFLMIIDFAFGGETYLSFNKDVVANIGHHDFIFTFVFSGISFIFQRYTATPDLIKVVNGGDQADTSISLDEYKKHLTRLYGLATLDASFRQIISVYCRVWGKNNYNVYDPLLDHPKQSGKDAVLILMKIFNRFEPIV